MNDLKELLLNKEMPSKFHYEGELYSREDFISIKGNAKVLYKSKKKIITVLYTMYKRRNFVYSDIKAIENIIIQ